MFAADLDLASGVGQARASGGLQGNAVEQAELE